MPNKDSKLGEPANWLADHGDSLYRYALGQLRDHQVAEDLVQETLLAALKARNSYSGQASVRTWLIGIMRRKAVDEFRRRGRQVDAKQNDATAIESFIDARGKWKFAPRAWGSDPSQLAENQEFWAVFANCRGQLPPTLAEAFGLRELESLDIAEICNILEITATNLSVRLHRARLALRQCLEKHWFTARH